MLLIDKFYSGSTPRLCAVLRTSSSIGEDRKGFWAFYAISTMASLVAQVARVSEKVEYLVYVSN